MGRYWMLVDRYYEGRDDNIDLVMRFRVVLWEDCWRCCFEWMI